MPVCADGLTPKGRGPVCVCVCVYMRTFAHVHSSLVMIAWLAVALHRVSIVFWARHAVRRRMAQVRIAGHIVGHGLVVCLSVSQSLKHPVSL